MSITLPQKRAGAGVSGVAVEPFVLREQAQDRGFVSGHRFPALDERDANLIFGRGLGVHHVSLGFGGRRRMQPQPCTVQTRIGCEWPQGQGVMV
jgi:hypothetical protein